LITIKLPYSIENITDLDLLRKQYSNVVRFSYNRFREGKSQKDVRLLTKSLKNISLNSWLVQCGIKEAEGIHKKNKDMKVIFGSKKNFYRRIKGLISNEELKEKRLLPINIQGEETKQGNRSFKLDVINNNQIIFKVDRNNHLIFKLPNLRPNYRKLLYNLENRNNLKQGEKGLTYGVRIDSNFIYIVFEEKQEKIKLIYTRYIGIDLNPNEIGISIKDGEKIIQVRKYILNIDVNNHHKVEYEIYEISKKISQLFKSYNCKFIFVEDLTIKSKNHEKGRKFNKMVNNQWIRNKFINNLDKRITSIGGKLFKVHPAYSSFIGNIMYNFDDSINASLEIGRRGYDLIINKNKKFYPDFNLSLLKDQWKEYFDNGIKTWKEFFLIIKNLELKYRVSLDNKVFSHLSKKSNVCYYSYPI